jgi:hypothetical protein
MTSDVNLHVHYSALSLTQPLIRHDAARDRIMPQKKSALACGSRKYRAPEISVNGNGPFSSLQEPHLFGVVRPLELRLEFFHCHR